MRILTLLFTMLCLSLTLQAQQPRFINFECYGLASDTFDLYNFGNQPRVFNGSSFPLIYFPGSDRWQGYAISSKTDTANIAEERFLSAVGTGYAGSKHYLVLNEEMPNSQGVVCIDTNVLRTRKLSLQFCLTKPTKEYLVNHWNTVFSPDTFLVNVMVYSAGSSRQYVSKLGASGMGLIKLDQGWWKMEVEMPTTIDSIDIWTESKDRNLAAKTICVDMIMDNFGGYLSPTGPAFANLASDTFYAGDTNYCGLSYSAESSLHFDNAYDKFSWGYSWSGFAASNKLDTLTAGFANQFSPIARPQNASSIIVNGNGKSIYINQNATATSIPTSLEINNTAYAYYSMKNGDLFARKFGDTTGGKDGKDYFYFTLTGYDHNGKKVNTVSHYLADFRATDTNQHFIQQDWQTVSLPLGASNETRRIAIQFYSSDTGLYGINTPKYFAIGKVNYSTVSSINKALNKSVLSAYLGQQNISYTLATNTQTVRQFRLVDIMGREVEFWQNDETNGQLPLNGPMKSGVYFLQALENGKSLGTVKLPIY